MLLRQLTTEQAEECQNQQHQCYHPELDHQVAQQHCAKTGQCCCNEEGSGKTNTDSGHVSSIARVSSPRCGSQLSLGRQGLGITSMEAGRHA